jgi:uncharacterized membrane protein YgaE (UPF0421/DUF939 family)
MENREMIANTEILNILKNIEPEYVYVLPIELIEYLNNNSLKDESRNYSGFNENGDIEVSDEAEEILTFMYLNYWAEENEKKELLEKLTNNEKELEEKYDIQKVFNKRNETKTYKEELQLVQVKDNLFTRILNKLKKLLRK